jgi:hypothetical protein
MLVRILHIRTIKLATDGLLLDLFSDVALAFTTLVHLYFISGGNAWPTGRKMVLSNAIS